MKTDNSDHTSNDTLLVFNVSVKNIQAIDLRTYTVANSSRVLFLGRQLSSFRGRCTRDELNTFQLVVQESLALSQSLFETQQQSLQSERRSDSPHTQALATRSIRKLSKQS